MTDPERRSRWGYWTPLTDRQKVVLGVMVVVTIIVVFAAVTFIRSGVGQ